MLKNKTVYYTKTKIKQSKMYGSITYKLQVFLVKSGKLVFAGEGEQNTASTPGERGECFIILQQAGLVPKKIKPLYGMFRVLPEKQHQY